MVRAADLSRLPAAEAQVLLASQIRCDGEAFTIVLNALDHYRSETERLTNELAEVRASTEKLEGE